MRFPEFSGEWEYHELQSIAPKISSGKDKPNNEGTVVLYGSTGIMGHTTTESYKSEIVIVARVGANAGQLQLVDIPCGVTDNALVVDAKSWNKYVFYYLQHFNLNKLVFGSGQPLITGGMLKKIKIWAGNNVERNKIVHLLSLMEERIDTQKKIIEKYESLIRGLTDTAFTIKSSITLINFSNLYKDAGEGGTPSTSNSEYYDGGTIPFIKIDDLMTKYLVTHKDCITEQGMQKSSAWLIPSSSVIYSNGATIGSIAINTYPVCTKQGILGIIPKDNVDVEYLYYFMTSVYFRKEIHRIITEGTMKTAYLKDINKILCPLPDLATQKSIANKLASVTKKIELDKRALSLLLIQKKHLLSHLFI